MRPEESEDAKQLGRGVSKDHSECKSPEARAGLFWLLPLHQATQSWAFLKLLAQREEGFLTSSLKHASSAWLA